MPVNLSRLGSHMANYFFQSLVLILAMIGLVAVCTFFLWGKDAMVAMLFLVALSLVITPSLPPLLIMRLYRAQPLNDRNFPLGVEFLSWLSQRADLELVPKLYYVPSPELNAFSAGGKHNAAIAVTDGLLRQLGPQELLGVLAHEVGHISNNDLWLMRLTELLSRLSLILAFLGLFLLFFYLPLLFFGVQISLAVILLLIFSPLFINYLQLAFSRVREFDADLSAIEFTGDPLGLAAALDKIERHQRRHAAAMLFPGNVIPTVLRSHPSTEERIDRLRRLYKQPRYSHDAMRITPPFTEPAKARLFRWRWPP